MTRIALVFLAVLSFAFCCEAGSVTTDSGSIKTQVFVTGGEEECVYNFQPRFLCFSNSITGSFTFDTVTNSVTGPWFINDGFFGYFSGDGSTVSVSGTDLANDQFSFDGSIMFSGLVLAEVPCPGPQDEKGNFCTAHGELIPVATVEPSSILLFGTSILGLVPFRRKLFGR